MRSDDYIGSDYYGFHYPSLVVAHTRGMTSIRSRTTYLPGNLVIVAAMGEDRNIYGFLGTAIEVIEGMTAGDIWAGGNDAPVNRLKVLTPIQMIPSELYSQMTQAGFKRSDRLAVATHLRDESCVSTPLPKTEPVELAVSPSAAPVSADKAGKIGCVYVIQNLLGEGYKIGITDNIHRRFRQLEIGTKAACIGYWSSENYKNLEKFLHTQFSPENVPQSEWFMLSSDQLIWTINWLNENASQVECNLLQSKDTITPAPTTRRWWRRLLPMG